MPVDTEIDPAERSALLDEVEAELPLWLARSAIPHPDPIVELTDLLRFDESDVRRVVAAHLCLSEPVERLITAIPRVLRSPTPSSDRPRDVGAAVRGPIDWPATVRLHAAGEPGAFTTRPRQRTFDTPEHRSLQWALERIGRLARLANAEGTAPHTDGTGGNVGQRLASVRRALRMARESAWLASVPAERPTSQVRLRLARSRIPFVRTALSPVVERLLQDDTADTAVLARILRQRYFVPARNWQLHEVVVLIRIDRSLSTVAVDHRRRKLLSASGTVAEYLLEDGDTIHVRQQAWPDESGVVSRRTATAARHGLRVAGTRPDIVVLRSGAHPDLVVLELKASRRHDTLGRGLTQLLAYLNDRPAEFGPSPAGWLVPLPFDGLAATEPDSDDPLWIVDAKRVADALRSRLVPQHGPG